MGKRIGRITFAQILFLIVLFNESPAQTFQDFVDRVTAAPVAAREAIVDSFMAAAPAFPLIENDTVAHFVYRGITSRVSIGGDHTFWDLIVQPMKKLSTTAFWYRSVVLESDARIMYRFFVGGTSFIVDPHNPNVINEGGQLNSELAMPAYEPPIEAEYVASIPHGAFFDTTFTTTLIRDSRIVKVYVPPDYESSSEHYPVVLFQDGLDYVNYAQANNVFDYLISENRIRPVIAVFVPPVLRNYEYVTSLVDEYTTFITEEVMPWVDARFRTSTKPADRAIIGASNGGNISLWIGLNHPEVFGNIGAQSSRVENYVMSGFHNKPKLDLKIYSDVGKYDIDFFIPRVDSLVTVLASKGYDYRFFRFNEGHNWRNWRAHLDNALEFFFPKGGVSIDDDKAIPQVFRLMQNYPNPFNPATTISYLVPNSQRVSLRVYDLLGREVAVLVDGFQAAGLHRVNFDGSSLASGVFVYKLTTGTFIGMKKMVLIK